VRDPAYRDPLASLRAHVAQLEVDLAPRVARLQRLRRCAVAPSLLEPPVVIPRDEDVDAARLGAIAQRLEARIHDVDVALARTDAALADLGYPGMTLQDEMLGDRAAPRNEVARLVGTGAIDVLPQATVARFRHRGVGFVFAAGAGYHVVQARLSVAVPRELAPVDRWPWDGLALGGALWKPSPLFEERVDRPSSTFWMSHGRAVIAWQERELSLPGGGLVTLLALRDAIAEAW
jgi:hypothetical protein